ncbi:Nif3-like dinuclear metal center hexameric protein [Fictibacillus nanhaiensis]|uniref:Nif3-like dinuclear metal center hexameric protein n=1 Tax=Fictibacillus nanhaiensis TaxID=742169 RepID=UPI001C95B5F0|nr:Nif3-like dinuclear metal center hexameric protein [Fictibacillus nanhaiensis]MBY6036792.1 Nif3-like dinuclear metal center hexameric protein [Fictibacillus nanhaiensis]
MANLRKIDQTIDSLFRYREIGTDPAFSRFIPMVYDPIGFSWREEFEQEFTQLFNGLMLKGQEEVGRIFLAVFPTVEVLTRFISESEPGDLLFMHHPLVMECGDPRGEWGKGFVPIPSAYIRQMKEKGLSVFTLHVPLDYSRTISTSDAMAEAFGARVITEFFKDDKGACGVICEVPATSTEALITKSKEIFQIPYADVEGPSQTSITKIAIAAGCGDKVDVMKEAEELGAQAYVTGEVHCHIDTEYGKKKYDEMREYIETTTMSLIGVSHSASEYLVHASQLKPWFEEQFHIPVTLIPQEKWWV